NISFNTFTLSGASSITSKRVFKANAPIYARYQIRNHNSAMPSGTRVQFYKNRPGAVAQGTVGDTGVNSLHAAFSSATTYGSYESSPGGANRAVYQVSTHSCTYLTSQIGDYTARAYANYNHSVADSDCSDNQATIGYSVITQPTSLNAS